MRILLLDDSDERAADIEGILSDYKTELATSHSLEDAKNKLKNNKFEIVIIDLYVPLHYKTKELSKTAGLEFVKYIFEESESIFKPSGVIVVSNYLTDIDYLQELYLYPVSIIDTNIDDWEQKIKCALDNFWLKINPVDIAIITAVDVEFQAIYDNSWIKHIESNSITFYRKFFKTDSNKNITAVLFQSEDKGMVPACIAMSELFKYYRPKTVFMIGVTAGNPNKTKCGDIIVASSSSDYSSGAIKDGDDGLVFESEANVIQATDSLIKKFKNYSRDANLLYEIRQAVKMPTYNTDIEIKVGLIASGPLVVKSQQLTEAYIRPYNKNYLGIDMETYAVYYACKKNNVDFITLKSVSDHGDLAKTHEHQIYCSKLVVELLNHYIYKEL